MKAHLSLGDSISMPMLRQCHPSQESCNRCRHCRLHSCQLQL